MKVLLPLLCCICQLSLYAQPAYKGGIGDGYASASFSAVLLHNAKPKDVFILKNNVWQQNEQLVINVSALSANVSLQIYDVSGRLLVEQKSANNQSVIYIPIQSFQSGIYFLSLQHHYTAYQCCFFVTE